MTDKQIIVDGVDVSGCNYGEIEKSIFKCSCEYNVCSASMFCEDNPDCYYKQLKRKEQECEKLRQEKKYLLGIKDTYVILYRKTKGQYYELEQELQRAEQKLEKIKEIVNTHRQNRCKACQEFDNCLGHPCCDEVILEIIEE